MLRCLFKRLGLLHKRKFTEFNYYKEREPQPQRKRRWQIGLAVIKRSDLNVFHKRRRYFGAETNSLRLAWVSVIQRRKDAL